ncbi:UNVERIFIED_CONTAM: hypothetical protein Sradi_3655700 [Sesamum radiatum]|uniref:Uncharacterized protein n=1 Tax=Sesamum radiatum TaxID=300843 RepID=A0AAW2QIC8_SESRA
MEWGNYVFTRFRCDHLPEQQQVDHSSHRPKVGWSKLSELDGMRWFEGKMAALSEGGVLGDDAEKTGGENVERRVKRSKNSRSFVLQDKKLYRAMIKIVGLT